MSVSVQGVQSADVFVVIVVGGVGELTQNFDLVLGNLFRTNH